MTPKMEKPAARRAIPEVSLAADGKIDPETNLAQRRVQYLAEIFALPDSTAAAIAELAFPEAPHA